MQPDKVAIVALKDFDVLGQMLSSGKRTNHEHDFLVLVTPMLASGVVTMQALYMIVLSGLQGIAIRFVPTWLCAMMLVILAYVKYAEDIEGPTGRLIYKR